MNHPVGMTIRLIRPLALDESLVPLTLLGFTRSVMPSSGGRENA